MSATTISSLRDIEQLAKRYAEAWNGHDVDAILEMHTDDAALQIFVGLPAFVGKEQMRGAMEQSFEMWRGYRFNSRNVYCRDGLVIYQGTISGTLTTELELGDITIKPTATEIEFEAVDVLPVESGLFTRKDSYIDVIDLKLAADAVA